MVRTLESFVWGVRQHIQAQQDESRHPCKWVVVQALAAPSPPSVKRVSGSKKGMLKWMSAERISAYCVSGIWRDQLTSLVPANWTGKDP